ncbi:MAG: TrkA family potassium uptake protein [Chloroflexi bacterium CFX1]|nr:TrkA family potassium uptake protein [Chloroflexi bacterium CFX1]MCK6567802.1 TrkA family potassium uptake protein [Anaerolineales bacterium]MCQ3953581.1 TrkA family potassium uptake protein [Chloroflexota bacterium]MDL1920426.1 TrkA family potassium uptake protein [Chloroflexi bacterium CFX5]NUQ59406.1 TrkA family potassium uptake protein [Anaerolineales bacterium]
MNFIVIGCGRFGAELAYRLFTNGHQVAVVDSDPKAFNRLHPDFRGRTVEGDSLSADTLSRAITDKTAGVAVVTNSDTMNAVIGHAVRVNYPNVQRIIVRNYDPVMRDMLESFGLQIISSTAWGAERMQELLIDPAFHAVFSAGNGEVEIYEMFISEKWHGLSVSSLLEGCGKMACVALTRAGRAELPAPTDILQKNDILTVSATLDGVKILRAKLQEGQED